MDRPTPHLPPLNPHAETVLQSPENHTTQKMEKFQQIVLKLAGSHPNPPLTPAARTLIQDRLSQFVSQYKTPDHPPYSAMIERAIRELNEKRGSSEDSISSFLKKEYDNLPWAHSMILKNHLKNLCLTGDIVLAHNKRYKLAGKIEVPILSSSSTKIKRRNPLRKKRWRWDRERERSRRRPKMNLIKLRIQQKGKTFKIIEEHQEPHVEEQQQLAEENGGMTAENGEACLQHQEIARSEITQEQPERQQSEPSRPKTPVLPGFESTRVENSPNSDPTQPEPASGKVFLESQRTCRQMRRWNRSYSVPKASTLNCHTPDENKAELKGGEGYSRKRKTRWMQSETIVWDVPMKMNQPVDVQGEHHPFEPYTKIDSPDHLPLSSNQPEFVSSNEKEAREMPQQPSPQHEDHLQENNQPRRSLRLRLPKPDLTKDESFVIIALPSQNCHGECWESVEPSEQKPVNQQQAMEPIKSTDRDMLDSPDKPFITARRPGRPPKRICARPNKDFMEPFDNEPEVVTVDRPECEGPHQLPEPRGRGRPPKVIANTHRI